MTNIKSHGKKAMVMVRFLVKILWYKFVRTTQMYLFIANSVMVDSEAPAAINATIWPMSHPKSPATHLFAIDETVLRGMTNTAMAKSVRANERMK